MIPQLSTFRLGPPCGLRAGGANPSLLEIQGLPCIMHMHHHVLRTITITIIIILHHHQYNLWPIWKVDNLIPRNNWTGHQSRRLRLLKGHDRYYDDISYDDITIDYIYY